MITSCVTKGPVAGSDTYEGFLQVYDVSDGLFPFTKQHVEAREIADPPWQHAVVGQGVLGNRVTTASGVVLPDTIRMLVPVVLGREGPVGAPSSPCNGSFVDLRDRDGGLVARFCHTFENAGLNNDTKPDLSCCALIVFSGRLYLLGIRHEFLYVYRIHWFGGANADAVVFARLQVALNVKTDCDLKRPGGASVDWPTYANVNLLQTDSGDVFMLCGHDEWLDTWHLGALNLNPLGEHAESAAAFVKPQITKIAIMDQNWKFQPKDLFEEGVAIFQDADQPNRIRFIATPWDYRKSRCSPLSSSIMCTHFWGWSRDL